MLHIIPKCIMKVLNNILNVDCMMIYDTNQALQIEIYFISKREMIHNLVTKQMRPIYS